MSLLSLSSRHREHAAQERMRMGHQRRMARRLAAEFNRVAASGSTAGHEERLRRMLAQEYDLLFSDFGRRLADTLGILTTKAKGDGPYERAARRYVKKNALTKAKDISQTTKDKLARVIAQTVIDGDQRKLEIAIREKLGGDEGRRRAETIARTESHSASQDAAFEMAQEAEIDLVKIWTSVEDARTRESHTEADGQVREMHEEFEVGDELLMYPGDPTGDASEVINCRCVCIYVPRRST